MHLTKWDHYLTSKLYPQKLTDLSEFSLLISVPIIQIKSVYQWNKRVQVLRRLCGKKRNSIKSVYDSTSSPDTTLHLIHETWSISSSFVARAIISTLCWSIKLALISPLSERYQLYLYYDIIRDRCLSRAKRNLNLLSNVWKYST